MCVQTNKTEFLHSPRSQIYLFLHFFSRKMLQVHCLLSFVVFMHACKCDPYYNNSSTRQFSKVFISYLSLFYICLLYDQARQHIKKQRHYFANKGPSSQSYGFSSSHIWIWELDYKKKKKKLSAKESKLLNCGVGEDTWESLGQHGDSTSPS